MNRGKGGKNGGVAGLLPSSFRVISSCVKTVSSNAGSVASTVRSAGASVAASIAASQPDDEKDQVLWTGFDKLELGPLCFKHVLLIAYANGFRVVDVEDANDFSVLVSRRDGPVTFLQMQPIPATSDPNAGFRASHPIIAVVGSDETSGSSAIQSSHTSASVRETPYELGNFIPTPTVVRFYSLSSHSYVHTLRFRSAVYIVRCSPRVVAVALSSQIFCFNAITLENKFSVLTYPLQGAPGASFGYGPMAVGPRWLAYAANSPLLSNTVRLSPQKLIASPGVSPSTSPSNGTSITRYAMESSKQLASGIINLGDIGYKTMSRICQDLLPDGTNVPLSSSSGRRSSKLPLSGHSTDADNAGMVAIKDSVSAEIICHFRAHSSPISALCFDPSGTLLVSASVHGHNINVFRIMRNPVANNPSSGCYDGSASHVHLYKLYRGLTAAAIHDFSFSQYSQWIAVISSHGTCHIYTMSPFGGDAIIEPQNLHTDGVPLAPHLSKPWWSKSSFFLDQQLYSPPPPPTVTVSVVGRIKNISGWLSTVSSVASLASGKTVIPSGAIAAIFHNSLCSYVASVSSMSRSLEHLLVCSPSEHVIQYELVSGSGSESLGSPTIGSGTSGSYQEGELHIIAEPIQWWDVCRRTYWPETDKAVGEIVGNQNDLKIATNLANFSSGENLTKNVAVEEATKNHEQPKWFLSNAEVQINSGRISIWRNSKVSFCIIDLSVHIDTTSGGEIEIEVLASKEVETRREMLPQPEPLHWHKNYSNNRSFNEGRNSSVLADGNVPQDGFASGRYENAGHLHGQSFSQKLDTGSRKSLQQQISHEDSNLILSSRVQSSLRVSAPLIQAKEEKQILNLALTSGLNKNVFLDGHGTSSEGCSPAVDLMSERELATVNSSSNDDSTPLIVDNTSEQNQNSDSHNSLEFMQYFHEGYCEISELDNYSDSPMDSNDGAINNTTHLKGLKPEEEEDNDDLIGGVFAFSEEG